MSWVSLVYHETSCSLCHQLASNETQCYCSKGVPAGEEELATLQGTPVDLGVTQVPASEPNALHNCGVVHMSALQCASFSDGCLANLGRQSPARDAQIKARTISR